MVTEALLRRRFTKLIRDAVTLAIDRGAKKPGVYVEGGSGLLIMDGPAHGDRTTGEEAGDVIVDIGWPSDVSVPDATYFDAGGW